MNIDVFVLNSLLLGIVLGTYLSPSSYSNIGSGILFLGDYDAYENFDYLNDNEFYLENDFFIY